MKIFSVRTLATYSNSPCTKEIKIRVKQAVFYRGQRILKIVDTHTVIILVRGLIVGGQRELNSASVSPHLVRPSSLNLQSLLA